MEARQNSLHGALGGPGISCDRCRCFAVLAALAALAFALLLLSPSAVADVAEPAPAQDSTAEEPGGGDAGGAEPSPSPDSPGSGEEAPGEPGAPPDTPASPAEDEPVAGAGDPVVAPPAPEVPGAAPGHEEPGSGEQAVEPPAAVSEEASGAAPEPLVPAPMVAAPGDPAEPHGSRPPARPSPQASRADVRAAVVKFLRTTIPLVRLRTAKAVRPALTSLALGVPPEPPARKAVATADEEPRPLPPFEGPGSPNRPYASGYGFSSPSGGGFPAGMAAVSTPLACTLLFERLVVAFSSCQSESFVSLRERPG